MPLLTAFEDLTQRSLAQLPTLWEKLRFLGELLTETGYRHWGLEQKYGSDASAQAIRTANGNLLEEFASASLLELWMSVGQAAYREQVGVANYLEDLREPNSEPLNDAAVPREHYQFIVTNLSRVARSRATSH